MPSFTNRATLSYRGNVTISNIVTVSWSPCLSATKTALSERYGADDILDLCHQHCQQRTGALHGVDHDR